MVLQKSDDLDIPHIHTTNTGCNISTPVGVCQWADREKSKKRKKNSPVHGSRSDDGTDPLRQRTIENYQMGGDMVETPLIFLR